MKLTIHNSRYSGVDLDPFIELSDFESQNLVDKILKLNKVYNKPYNLGLESLGPYLFSVEFRDPNDNEYYIQITSYKDLLKIFRYSTDWNLPYKEEILFDTENINNYLYDMFESIVEIE